MLRVSAVSYINTWPLVWGFLHGSSGSDFEFQFDFPAQCAAAVGSGAVDIGLVPCAELDRLGIEFLPEVGIASNGPVRSILLISKRPMREIRTLAADEGSRTSVALSRILLAEQHGVTPSIMRRAPDLQQMLADADAALIIGDAALGIEPEKLPYECLDLGEEWTRWCGLPMVFAVWAGRKSVLTPEVARVFVESYAWGRDRVGEIAARAARERGFEEKLVRKYLTQNVEFALTPRHREGLALFRDRVRALDAAGAMVYY